MAGDGDAVVAEPRWAEHQARAEALMSALEARPPAGPQPSYRSATRTAAAVEWARHIGQEPPEVVGSVLTLIVRHSATPEIEAAAGELLRHPFAVRPVDAVLAVRAIAAEPDSWRVRPLLSIAIAMLTHAVANVGTDELAAPIQSLALRISDCQTLPVDERRALVSRLFNLLPVGDRHAQPLLIAPVDGWGRAILRDLATLTTGIAEVNALLRHLASVTANRPSATWKARSMAMLRNPEARALLRLLLTRVTDAEPIPARDLVGRTQAMLVAVSNGPLLGAAAWAAALIGEPWVVPTLTDIAVRALRSTAVDGWIESEKVPNACFTALGDIGSPEAVAALQRLYDSTRHRGRRTRITTALTAAAAKAGLSRGQLVERNVPTAGLDVNAARLIGESIAAARLVLHDDLRVAVSWNVHGRPTDKPTGAVPAATVEAVRLAVREVRTAVSRERRRLEGLFAADRSWSVLDWRRYYLDHPVTGPISRGLLWRFTGPAGTVTGLPTLNGRLRSLCGEIPLSDTGTVALWHPALASDVSAWRDWLLDRKVRQPFKQAWREIYLLTSAERTSGDYSNRFAAHVLRYRGAYALFKERGWSANFLGPYDGGWEGRARREFLAAGLTVVFEHLPVGDLDTDRIDLCDTGRVWFYRTTDRRQAALPLIEVPPPVFSEAMRDVDLFVSMNTIALDPEWVDRREDPNYRYWQRTAFGELTVSAETRRDVLARLLPNTKIAGRVELCDRYLRVRGNLRTYRIHLGSAHVTTERDGRWLCLVPARSARSRRVLLPFEGDEVLSLILSKALMLAADDRVTDGTILIQLAPGR